MTQLLESNFNRSSVLLALGSVIGDQLASWLRLYIEVADSFKYRQPYCLKSIHLSAGKQR